jgi:predicted Zn-dependent peptidase
VIVATGNVSHQEIVDSVDRAFSSLPKTPSVEGHEAPKAVFTPSLMMIRDDEMVNSNVGVFYEAPSVSHPDYYGFLLLKHVFGEYSIDKNAEHLNDVRK